MSTQKMQNSSERKTTSNLQKKQQVLLDIEALEVENKRLLVKLEEAANANDALEEKRNAQERAFNELSKTSERQAQELTLLEKVRSMLALQLALDELLKNIVQAIVDVYSYSHVSIYLLEGDALLLKHQIGYKKVIHSININEGVSGQVVRTGKPILVKDAKNHPLFLEAENNLQSEITVPLMDETQVFGTLSVESTGSLTEVDLKILMTLSADVSFAIGRARLYEDVQNRNSALSALQEATLAVMGELSLPDALRAILKQAAQLIGTSHGYIYLLQSDGSLQLTTGIGVYPKYIGLKLQKGEGLAGKVWETAKPFALVDYEEWEGRSEKFGETRFYAIIGIPIMNGSSVGGILGLSRLTPGNPFTDQDLDLLNRFCQLVSIAINNASLYTQARKELVEHQQTEVALRDMKEQYRQLVEQLPLVVYQDRPGIFGETLYISPQIVDLLGYTSDDYRKDPSLWKTIVHPDDYKQAVHSIESVISHGKNVSNYRMVTKNGEVIWVRDTAVAISNEKGEVDLIQGFLEDVTERIQAVESLRKSERRLQAFFNQSLDGFFFCDFEEPVEWKHVANKEAVLDYIINTKRFTDVNNAMLEQYGISREQFLQLTTKDIFAHDLEQGRNLRRQLFNQGSLHIETSERTTNGEPVWFEGDYVCLYDENECITGYFGIQRDITDRKNTEKALRESEERYRTLFNGMLDGIYRSTHTGRFVDVNPSMVQMFGFSSRDEMLNVDIKKELYFAPEERGSHILDTGQQETEIYRMRRKDGNEIWVEDHGYYVHDEQGNILYHEGILRDVTERVYAENALRAAEENYRSIFENAIEGIYQSSPAGFFLTVNPAFATMLGFASPQDMLKSVTDIAGQLYSNPSRRDDFKLLLEEEGSISGFEYQMKRQDGQIVWVSENARIVRNANGNILYYEGILEDITARKLNEQQLDNHLKQLNALHAIDTAINSNFDLRMTLEVILREVLTQLKVDAASMLLFNKDTHTLNYTAGRGFLSKATQYTKLGMGEGFAGRVLVDRKTLHIPNLSKTETRLANALSMAGENFSAYIGSPLIAKGQIVGVLEIFQRSPLHPDQDWLDFLGMIADQAAIAIDNAQLFENLQRSNFELTLAYDATIEGWSRALDLRDRETEGHTQRVTNLTLKLAQRMGIPDTDIMNIRRGALLHDIGKMGIPDNILHKPDQLTPEEWEIMRQHTTHAYNMLHPIAYLKPALDIPQFHHERWDGTGYPKALRGEQIPISARIFAVVDVWDALTSDRSYREAWSKEMAAEYIRNESGKHFDPRVVDIFLSMIEEEDFYKTG